jgi:hypothetical protein
MKIEKRESRTSPANNKAAPATRREAANCAIGWQADDEDIQIMIVSGGQSINPTATLRPPPSARSMLRAFRQRWNSRHPSHRPTLKAHALEQALTEPEIQLLRACRPCPPPPSLVEWIESAPWTSGPLTRRSAAAAFRMAADKPRRAGA